MQTVLMWCIEHYDSWNNKSILWQNKFFCWLNMMLQLIPRKRDTRVFSSMNVLLSIDKFQVLRCCLMFCSQTQYSTWQWQFCVSCRFRCATAIPDFRVWDGLTDKKLRVFNHTHICQMNQSVFVLKVFSHVFYKTFLRKQISHFFYSKAAFKHSFTLCKNADLPIHLNEEVCLMQRGLHQNNAELCGKKKVGWSWTFYATDVYM